MFHNYKLLLIVLISVLFIIYSCRHNENLNKAKENMPLTTAKEKPKNDDNDMGTMNRNHELVLRKQIVIDNYKVSVSEDTMKQLNNKSSFWSIYLIIEDILTHKITFRQAIFQVLPKEDSVFNRIDFDNDQKLELMVIGSRVMTSYTFQQGLIIDFKIKPEPILMINDPNIIKVRNSYMIKTEVRGSPSVLVFSYDYCLKYSNGKLLWEYIKGINSTKCTCGLDKKNEFNPAKSLMLLYNNKSLCENDEVNSCLEMYLLDKLLTDRESEGWAYFDKIYQCKDKEEKRKILKEELDGDLKYIKEYDYKFE